MAHFNISDPDLFRYLTFTSKEEYLQAKAQWKQDYKFASYLIKQKRLRRKEIQRALEKYGRLPQQRSRLKRCIITERTRQERCIITERTRLERCITSEQKLKQTVAKLIKAQAVMKTLACLRGELAKKFRTV